MPARLRSDVYVKIDGVQMPPAFSADLWRLEVDSNLFLPDMCTLELHDDELAWIDDSRFQVGKALQVSIGGEGEDAQAVFNGEVAAIEARFSDDAASMTVVRAYDRAHRLHRNQKTRSWNDIKDSDIVSAIAGEHGLQAETSATTLTYPYVLCDNKTDYEFVSELARRNGFAFTVDDRKLCFKKPDDLGYPAVALHWGDTLLEFRPVLSVASQPAELTVRGWDPKTKRAVVGQQTSSTFESAKIGAGTAGHALAQSAFGKASVTVADYPVATQSEADTLARGLLTGLWSSDVKGDGRALGHPDIRPGCRVQLTGIGTRFGGDYYVTKARHVVDASGYLTEFSTAGLTADTTSDRITGGTGARVTSHQEVTRGLAIAIVTNNQDPEKLGRVKLKFPWLDEATESTWAPVASTDAGNKRGFMFVPEVNDEVLVGFLHGDAAQPFILGGLWNGKDVPPEGSDQVVSNGAVNQRIIASRSGHKVTFDDTSGSEKISIVDKTGNNKITIDSSSPGKIQVECSGDVEITAKGDLKMSGRSVSLEGKLKLELKAPQVDVKGDTMVKIGGAMVQIN